MNGLRGGSGAAAVRSVAVLGTGVIGCSWAALFAGRGMRVHLFDSHLDAGARARDFWLSVKDTLLQLGLAEEGMEPEWHVFDTAAAAVADADFVQECIPERLELKRALYAEIEPALKSGAVVATSTSGLKLSDLQEGWRDPGRLIVAHPFNPPHIIPLVELFANERTAPDALETARALFESSGKKTITLKREVMGHVANRLQAALWREAIHLVLDGVASVEDVDTAITAGPGMRWAVMGPHMLLNLGGGDGGLRAYCGQFRDSYAEWWNSLGTPYLTADTVETLMAGVQAESGSRDYRSLVAERDAKLVALSQALRHAGNPR